MVDTCIAYAEKNKMLVGVAVVGVPGDTTTGVGTLASGGVEMSNVDLAQEFTSIITAQRGFQVLPALGLVRQDVVHAAYGLQGFAHAIADPVIRSTTTEWE